MNKSVYSLVLSDEVVRAVDKLAYKYNKNRSGMINEILAEYLSLVTPEVRIKQIIRSMENYLSGSTELKIQPMPTDATFVVKSALRYKYNPVIKYSVALYKNNRSHFGCIKAGIRTQNLSLISIMNSFFKMFSEIEEKFIEFNGEKFHARSDGRLERKILVGADSNIDDELMGQSVSKYIDNLDNMIKYYFNHINENRFLRGDMEKMYTDYLKKAEVIL